ncbi:MAG TPA: tannase/feruloyl esterase family alpha/beta hydrolase [Crenalkalicoccus sp.]|jgi:feruloyl esterase|nr:tannase/feruloyl esterase family alpha/beta hydrolase [Crenalkalicoccus sp.]
MRDTAGGRLRAPAIALGAGALLLTAWPHDAAAARSCADLATLALPGNGSVTAAEEIPAGSYTPPGTSTAYPNLPAFCRIAATLRPSPDSNIRVEVWMPMGAAWNGRLNGTGNGGYAGTISYSALATGTALGFATANTDQGTSPSTGLDGTPLVGHPQKWIDFGHRATHLMTTAAKRLISEFYDQGPSRSYFTGCSDGGHQAYQEAQRFPEDYDGILAGAPANNRTHLQVGGPYIYNSLRASPASGITEQTGQVITQAVLAACAGKDGGLASDPFLTDPRQCRFDPRSIVCGAGGPPGACLTPEQAEAARLLYRGPHNPRTGQRIYVGVPRGSESGHTFDWALLGGLTDPNNPRNSLLFNGLLQWVFGAGFQPVSFDFDRNVRQLDQVLAGDINANDPDLRAFRARGGKLLSYHGLIDSLVPPYDNINYHLRVVQAEQAGWEAAEQIPEGADTVDPAALRRTQEFYRLFLVPGMGHCGGGPGPNVLTASPSMLFAGDPERNALVALQRWVEQGVAPERLVATHFVNNSPAAGIAFTRPLCPFPQIAQYRGTGPTTDAASFDCVPGPVGPNQNVTAEYLR